MKVILLPFAGANKQSYTKFFQAENTVTLEYPGRGSRMNEPLLSNINNLVDDVFLQLKKEIMSGEDYILYGHSLGGLVGYLLCKRIEKLGFKKPHRFVVTGRMAPTCPVPKILSNLLDDEFWEEIWQLGGTPAEMKENPELLELFAPILKADIKCVEDYKYIKGEKLTIPIYVLFGSTESILLKDVEGWKDETEGKVCIKELVGDHFFIYNYKDTFNSLFQKVM
jgi:external thioesterase TEII